MKKIIAFTALIVSSLTLLAVWSLGWANLPSATKLENGKVRVREITYPAGVAREPHVRQTDQVIVFLNDCRYERTDPDTGAKTVRQRKAGDVIWHSKGEAAPRLVNLGSQPYRTLVIELK